MSAVESVSDPDFLLHSFHCYFLSPVQSNADVVYRVDESKDGRIFSSRSLKALQGEKLMFQCLVLFRRGSNMTLFVDHSSQAMPRVPLPDDVTNGTDGSYMLLQTDKRALAVFVFSDEERLDVMKVHARPHSHTHAHAHSHTTHIHMHTHTHYTHTHTHTYTQHTHTTYMHAIPVTLIVRTCVEGLLSWLLHERR